MTSQGSQTFLKWFRWVGLTSASAVMLIGLATAASQTRFYADDPIEREPEPGDASRVQPFPVHLSWDILSSLFVKEGDPVTRLAQNINTIDEVPDSSWFTNRAGSQTLTAADVGRGPDTTSGPVGRWTVVSGKSEGVRPGFTIMDSDGVRWFLKFDAPGYPEQATGAEVVATKLFWALGYDVAETHVATLWRGNLVLSEKASISVNGKKRRMTARDIRHVLAQSERSPDGSYRVLASKQLAGKSVDEFLYYGTRADDPNDVVPHENRRELRGMKVFAAWIDRVDAKAGNTLDTLVIENGKTIVRHHPLDFGSTLGSAGDNPNEYWEGYEFLYSGASFLKNFLGVGLPVEPWHTIRYPAFRGIGRIEGDRFDPETWRSRVPNAAYVRADDADTFWAARKVMAITDDMIAAAVKNGQYSDPSAENYLIETLIKRRNAIGRTYLVKINPIVNPTLDATGVLAFQNAAVDANLVPAAGVSYQAAWYQFDNATGDSVLIGNSVPFNMPGTQAPATLPTATGSFVRVDISTSSNGHPTWLDPVRVYLRRTPSAWKLAGLERK
jgi:hypothetical protein